MGDPAGIGPQVLIKALAHPEVSGRASFLVVGDDFVLTETARRLGLRGVLKKIVLINLGNVDKGKFRFAKPDAHCGKAAVEYITTAVDLIRTGAADAVVTAPISKEAAGMAGFKWPGHTEFLAHLTGAKKFCMMLAGGPLRVVLATRHIALKDVSRKLNSQEIYDAIILTAEALKGYFRIRHPKIAVAALNPHAGEGGMFGDEERKVIVPAINKAKRTVKDIAGPLSADSLFYDAYRGKYDAEIVMYHDQGLIPLKMVAKDTAVNITLGLPFVRTSPAHGTAFDIAGKNKANPSSMIEAIKLACQLATR